MWQIARVAGALLTLGIVAGCGGSDRTFHLPTRPTPVVDIPTPTPTIVDHPSDVRSISVGEVVTEDIKIANQTCAVTGPWPIPCRFYELTAPASGTLVATLTWDPVATGNILMLKIDDTEFRPQASPWSPVTARVPVVSGQRYSLAVGLAGADDVGQGPYTLTTKIE